MLIYQVCSLNGSFKFYYNFLCTSRNLPVTLKLADVGFLSFHCLAQVTACGGTLATAGRGTFAGVGKESFADVGRGSIAAMLGYTEYTVTFCLSAKIFILIS